MKEVITVDEVNFFRRINAQIDEFRDRWNDTHSWYPRAQQEQYSHLGEIYKESLAKYGDDDFLKYAQLKRLRSRHTKTIVEPKREADHKVCCYPMDHMQGIKPSVTTNGEYGLIPPAHHYSCMKEKYSKVLQCERFH